MDDKRGTGPIDHPARLRSSGLEHTSASVNGEPRSYTLRVTQVYRREQGEWKVAHRHGDTVTDSKEK